MIGRKPFMLVLVGLVILLATAVFVPSVFAAQTTHIMYAQENTFVYAYTPPTTGTYDVSLSWGNGTAVWPQSEVDGAMWGWQHQVQVGDPAQTVTIDDPYYDLTEMTVNPESLYAGTNPEVGEWVDTDAANHPVYFGVMPYVGDVTFHLIVKFTPDGGGGQTTIEDQTGTCTASDGTAYIPALPNGTTTGTWHSSRQYWAGTAASAYCDWNDYAEGRSALTGTPLAHPGPYAAFTQDTEYAPPAPATDTEIDPNPGTGTTTSTATWDTQWYNVAPEIWPAYARPNVVGTSPDPTTSALADMKPDSILTTTAPLWYTYSYPDSAVSAIKPVYMLGTYTSALASKRNYNADGFPSQTISCKFYGPSITWVYTKVNNAGIANVTVDGVAPTVAANGNNGKVDQYSATPLYQQTTTWTGYGANAYHTIKVMPSGSKNTASSSVFMYHDAFQAAKGTDPACTALMGANYRQENNYDGSTTETWGTYTGVTGAVGGGLSVCKFPNGATALTFQGTQVTWDYYKATNGGKENVIIDGVLKGVIDEYAATAGASSVTYSGLAASPAWHTIFITGSGSKNTASSSVFQYSDAFLVQPGSHLYDN